MKISHSELVQIIKEEVAAYKKVKLLENRKREILNLLREMEECGTGMYEDTTEENTDEMVDEILGLFRKKEPSPEQIEKMKKFIQSHGTYRDFPSFWASKLNMEESEVLDKLAYFFAQEGTLIDGGKNISGVKSFMFDPQTQKFTNKTKISMPYGPSSGKGEV